MPRTAERTKSPDLWAALPNELAPILRREIHSLAGQIMEEIQRQIPEYARPMDNDYVHTIRRGVEEALSQFVDQIADPSAPQERCAEVHRALGRAEMAEGRTLDDLQAAYRLGARLAWRRVASIGERARVASRTMLLLGEAIWAHIDELSALSVEGFANAQARAAGTLARRRGRLLELLLADPQAPHRTLEEAATTARWSLPAKVTAVALERSGTVEATTNPLDNQQALVDLECAEPHLLIASERGEQNEIDWDNRLVGWRAAIGPSVALHEAPHSLRWARRLLGLGRCGLLGPHRIVHCEGHLATLLLLGDENLTLEIIKRVLAPLLELKPKQRAWMGQTLLDWLRTRSGAPEVAQRLQVHPQTVRYRLHQLEELFGDSLYDPEVRFEMELALRASNLLLNTESKGETETPGTLREPV